MKRIVLLFLPLLFPLMVGAQVKFGYFSYEQTLKWMPEYKIVVDNMNDLKSKYDAETKRVEEEFNRKYEEFLDGQRDFAPTILQKRQTELQELLNRNVAFKAESERLLAEAEKEAFAPLHQKLSNALQKIGAQNGYAFILNTDGNACPYIDPTMGEDVTNMLKEALK
ncbi:MAG: OmpH family outer membrane protein [Prevotella sp.]|nr:OmpH family outer membrane protein [Prevotella sp.]MBR3089575.1 OmpH family outer membrane protein [Prevotella sp.]